MSTFTSSTSSTSASSPTATDHAIVIGGSIAGLLSAQVLTQYFARVTVIERDHLPDAPTFRNGAPHARHAHGLLVRGQEIMESYFPGMTASLLEKGAIRANLGQDLALSIGGVRVQPYESALHIVACSRPLLEQTLYQRLRGLPQVQFLDGRDVVGLNTDASNRRVTGLRMRQRGGDAAIEELAADLVVDASGRSSKAPAWLTELGYDAPAETSVDAQAGYASRIYRRTQPFAQYKAIYGMPQAPHLSRGCILVPMEDDRWQVTLTGMNGDHPPTDEAGFMAFAKSVPVPEFHAALAQLEPLTDAYGFRGGANRLRHYEKLSRHLEGLLAVGDAVYALNPVYGQGMTVAALGVQTLDATLRQAQPAGFTTQTGMARAFFKQLAKVNAGPWQMATGQDARWPTAAAQHQLDPVTRLIQRYFDAVLETMVDNGEVAEAFSYVQNMLKAPTTLFHPRIVSQVLRARFRKGKPQASSQRVVTQEGYV